MIRKAAVSAILLAGGLLSGLAGAGQEATSRPGAGAPRGGRTPAPQPEEDLWKEISVLNQPTATSQPVTATQADEAWFASAERRRATLLAKVQLYLTLFPGGVHRDEAIQLELATLFELGTLRGGNLEPLRQRVAEYLRGPPSEAALHEAAYWDIFCRRGSVGVSSAKDTGKLPVPAETRTPSTMPAPAGGTNGTRSLAPDQELLAAERAYIERYPRSRYVPRLATLVFEAAARRGDRPTMQAILAGLRQHFPDDAVTAALTAAWNRGEVVGRPFWLTFRTAEGRTIDTRESVGHPVLIVVWAGFDEAARRCVQRVEQFRAAQADLRVVGVSLDASPDETASVSRTLGLAWAQFNDGLGWANEFARTWGVRQVPFVFVIDRSGRLVGWATDDTWEPLALGALRDRSD